MEDFLIISKNLTQYETIWDNMKQKKWWRRRESNPRPEAFHLSLYVRSLSIYIRQMTPTQARDHEASLQKIHCLDAGYPGQLSCLTVTQSRRAGAPEWVLAVLCSQCVLVFRVGVCVFVPIFTRFGASARSIKLPYPRRIQFAPMG